MSFLVLRYIVANVRFEHLCKVVDYVKWGLQRDQAADEHRRVRAVRFT